jgi:hypothetical protein
MLKDTDKRGVLVGVGLTAQVRNARKVTFFPSPHPKHLQATASTLLPYYIYRHNTLRSHSLLEVVRLYHSLELDINALPALFFFLPFFISGVAEFHLRILD